MAEAAHVPAAHVPTSGETADGPRAPADVRVEHDTMGEVLVPANALYGAQTQRAVDNFPISGVGLPPENLIALAQLKQAAAQANAHHGVLSAEVAQAIADAAEQVIEGLSAGRLLDEFPIDVYQTGSGTSSNMNMNEVLARLATLRRAEASSPGGVVSTSSTTAGASSTTAGASSTTGSPSSTTAGASSTTGSTGSTTEFRAIHPNDDVNASQSSNDVYPTSVHLAAVASVTRNLLPALEHLSASLARRADDFAIVVKSGRTHLMDATPVTLGQEFSGYAAAVDYGVERVRAALPRVAEVPLGGTAVGTGINTPPGFAALVLEFVSDNTGIPLTEARNHFEAQAARDALVELSGQLKTIAVSLTKICNDLRWMGSGPITGLAEIQLPDLQPGSSIMPGKVNPVIPEAVLMVCARVIGNDATITWAGASGLFELNVQIPVISAALLESIRLLANAATLLADNCIAGIIANTDRLRSLAESSPSIATPLNKVIGYENGAKVVKHALATGRTIRESVLDLGFEVPDLDERLDVLAMTRNPTPGG